MILWSISGRNHKDKGKYYDYNLIAVVILLSGFGLVMLYSTSSYIGEIQYHNDMYFFSRQALYSCVSIVLAILISRLMDYHILERFAEFLNVLSILLMLMVRFSPMGREINHSRRWLKIGPLQFQPAELAKIAVIVMTPLLIVHMGRKFRGVKATIVALLPALIQGAGAYILTDNLSTAIIIVLIGFTIVFVAHPKTWPFLALVGVAAIAAVGMVEYVRHGGGGTFRSSRVLVWLHPERYASKGGYQILQGLYALGSGGLLGKGFGNSTQKLGTLPEAQNDMIFSVICEELGVVGALIIVLLFIYLLYRLFVIAQNAPDAYGSLIVTGVFAHVAFQVILNIAVALNLIPTTGVTLPFISYGGTSIVFLMGEMAIALSVSGQIRSRQRKRDLWGDTVYSR